jgi:hypothetical protein
VPFSGLAELGPPATFVVSYHQPLALRVELLVANAPGIALARELGIAAVGFLEIYLSLSKIHSTLGSSMQLIRIDGASGTPEHPTKSATFYTIASVPRSGNRSTDKGPNGRMLSRFPLP